MNDLEVMCRLHEWDSIETRDLMERMDLLKKLRDLPLNELQEILKKVQPRTAVTIIALVGGSKNE